MNSYIVLKVVHVLTAVLGIGQVGALLVMSWQIPILGPSIVRLAGVVTVSLLVMLLSGIGLLKMSGHLQQTDSREQHDQQADGDDACEAHNRRSKDRYLPRHYQQCSDLTDAQHGGQDVYDLENDVGIHKICATSHGAGRRW